MKMILHYIIFLIEETSIGVVYNVKDKAPSFREKLEADRDQTWAYLWINNINILLVQNDKYYTKVILQSLTGHQIFVIF